jgi:hypothetical protein
MQDISQRWFEPFFSLCPFRSLREAKKLCVRSDCKVHERQRRRHLLPNLTI